MQSLPREVFLKEDGLCIRLAEECRMLRKKKLYSLEHMAFSYVEQGKVLAECRQGEICCKVKIPENSCFTVRVFASREGMEYTELKIDHILQRIILDRSRSAKDANVETQQIEVPITGWLCEYRIDMILDHSSVEVFINEQYTISARVFPENVFGGISISECSGQGMVEELVIYEFGL